MRHEVSPPSSVEFVDGAVDGFIRLICMLWGRFCVLPRALNREFWRFDLAETAVMFVLMFVSTLIHVKAKLGSSG